jgi:hypothetical protein
MTNWYSRFVIAIMTHRYLNTGDGNLVVIHVGAGIKGQQQAGQEMRLGTDGKPVVTGTPSRCVFVFLRAFPVIPADVA